jgi:signal transduction histidine kinase
MMHGRSIRSSTLSLLTPITVEGAVVGYLAFAPSGMMRGMEAPSTGWSSSQFESNAPDLLQELSLFLMRAAALGGILALIFGVVMSRGLTAPLNRLAEAAQAIGSGRLGHRVSLAGGEEMRTVAHSFNEMAARLEQAELLRRNMLADVAHELRTPLTVLQGNLQAMLDGVYRMEQEEVARLYAQTRQLHRLVDDLHLLAQAEARQLPLHPQPVDVNQLLREAVDIFAPLAEEQGVRLAVAEAEGDPLPTIQADRARLGQVFHNLVSNALRHTPAGGEVILSAQAEDGRVHIRVADSGEGIAPEHLPQVFERFYRTDKARNRDSGGTGLGLAIVQAIVHAHTGQIWAESPGPGQGTTIHLVIG